MHLVSTRNRFLNIKYFEFLLISSFFLSHVIIYRSIVKDRHLYSFKLNNFSLKFYFENIGKFWSKNFNMQSNDLNKHTKLMLANCMYYEQMYQASLRALQVIKIIKFESKNFIYSTETSCRCLQDPWTSHLYTWINKQYHRIKVLREKRAKRLLLWQESTKKNKVPNFVIYVFWI